ncbi:MAG: hypothetical protein MOGMAGMI_02329 [Candidatus Omnitrophica bacterium]|nr:hypothetical protein [Candidatus Omnitrophota bacterium]
MSAGVKEEVKFCECCGARLMGRWERVTPGLVRTLIKFKRAVLAHNRNRVHVWKEAGLVTNELCNFQKLRFHALVAKVRDANGDHEIGYWLLTKRGNQFLKGLVAVPRRVFVFRNEVKNHDAGTVTIKDVLRSQELPHFETRDTLEYEIDGDMAHAAQKDLFDGLSL